MIQSHACLVVKSYLITLNTELRGFHWAGLGRWRRRQTILHFACSALDVTQRVMRVSRGQDAATDVVRAVRIVSLSHRLICSTFSLLQGAVNWSDTRQSWKPPLFSPHLLFAVFHYSLSDYNCSLRGSCSIDRWIDGTALRRDVHEHSETPASPFSFQSQNLIKKSSQLSQTGTHRQSPCFYYSLHSSLRSPGRGEWLLKRFPFCRQGAMSLCTAEMCSVNLPHKGREEKKGLKVFSLAGKREVRLFELEK